MRWCSTSPRVSPQLCPDVRIVAAGRAIVEIAFERDTPEAGAAEIDRVRKAFLRALDIDGEIYKLQMFFGIAAAPSSESDEVRLAEAAEIGARPCPAGRPGGDARSIARPIWRSTKLTP
ncbi:MAG: hypothetical protein WDN44_16360 [Sphingomonas sp.]